MSNIPIYRAKSNERKNTYVEGFLIGVDEDIGLCTIRTKDDYIGGEICYLDTLSIHFPDMIDSQGNKIFASLQEDGKGGDIMQDDEYIGIAKYIDCQFVVEYENYIDNIDNGNFDVIGIQE